MYIVIQQKNGVPYATLTESIRNGKKVTKKYTNLGRVLDKERGIYQNRKLGVFTYDPGCTYKFRVKSYQLNIQIGK